MKSNQEITVHCGKTNDGFEKLKKLCEIEADEICLKINIESTPLEIPFWTEDIPELICIGKFNKRDDGSMKYDLDFSKSTL